MLRGFSTVMSALLKVPPALPLVAAVPLFGSAVPTRSRAWNRGRNLSDDSTGMGQLKFGTPPGCLETVTQSYPLRPARLLDWLGGSFEPWGFSTLLMRFPSRFGFVNLFETRVVVWLGLTTEFESFPAVHPSLVSTFLFVLHRSRCRQWRSNPSWCHVVRCPPRWAMAATAVWRCPQGAAPDHWRLVAYWPWAQPWVQRLGWCRAGRAGRAGAGKRWSETCWRRWWKCPKWQMLDRIEAILDVLLRLSNFGMGSTFGGWNLDCLLPKMACVSHLQRMLRRAWASQTSTQPLGCWWDRVVGAGSTGLGGLVLSNNVFFSFNVLILCTLVDGCWWSLMTFVCFCVVEGAHPPTGYTI